MAVACVKIRKAGAGAGYLSGGSSGNATGFGEINIIATLFILVDCIHWRKKQRRRRRRRNQRLDLKKLAEHK